MNTQTKQALKMAIEGIKGISEISVKLHNALIDFEEALQQEASEQSQSAMMDVAKYGQSVMLDGKHIPLESIYVQEPVAWMSPDKKSCLEFARKDTVYGLHTIPLYTHPAQPLSVEKIDELAKQYLGHTLGLYNYPSFARAIEIAHGIRSKYAAT